MEGGGGPSGPSAGEATPLLGSDAAAPLKPARERSGGHGPFYGALRRTRKVAKALTNPWPKARTAAPKRAAQRHTRRRRARWQPAHACA